MYRKLVMVVVSVALAVGASPAASMAQTTCPEVEAAKQAYAAKLKALNVKEEDIQGPRSLAGTTGKQRSVQAPRSRQEAPRQSQQEAPRQGVQEAPRQGVQEAPRQSQQEAPRQGVQEAPRQSQQEAPRANLAKARALITDAEKACSAGKAADAAKKGNAALRLLK